MIALAGRLAWRELRGGLRGFRVFLFCLALGVAAIAAVGSVRMAISEGIAREGRALLGGDAAVSFTYRAPSAGERGFLAARSATVGEAVEFRSMAVVGADRALVQLRGVDDTWPLVGEAALEPPLGVADALTPRDGRPSVVIERLLAERLGVQVGDTLRLGAQDFTLAALLLAAPDDGADALMAPRGLARTEALREAGLIAPGSLYETELRLLEPEPGLREAFAAAFPDAGARWRDIGDPAPGAERFVGRLTAFLILVGLAALAVGGVGVASAVRRHMEEKTGTIAVLKTLGAGSSMVFAVYLIQIAALAALGVALGLVLGGALPAALGPVLAERLPVPAAFGLYAAPLVSAALFGMLTALAFALPPLARARQLRAAALFREAGGRGPASRAAWIAAGLAGLALGAAAVGLSGAPELALWFCLGLAAALGLLWLAGTGLRMLCARLARGRAARGRPALRFALAALGGKGGDATGAVLALGLGLTVLAAIGQIDANLRALIARELPERAPAFFFVDIQNAQLDEFLALTEPAESVETAPMLRGVITALNGVASARAEIDPEAQWVLRGDRGVSYAAAPPPGAILTEGAWWPADYAGPPLVSFSDEHGRELGLQIGDSITVNILGRSITAEVANFRVVEFRDMGINFLMILDPGAFAGAPHTHIATVYAPREAEGALMRAVGRALPNVTAIGVRDIIGRVAQSLGDFAAAARWAAGATLLAGVAVLIGAAAAGERRRAREAAILKTLGASRATILSSFALRAALTGAAAGVLAAGLGIVAGWGAVTFALDAAFTPEPISALAIVGAGALASLLAGLAFARGPLRARPAQVLRARE